VTWLCRHIRASNARFPATSDILELPGCDESPDCGFIERQWQELPDETTRAFVGCGVKRELILLDRDADTQRARGLLRHGPRGIPSQRRGTPQANGGEC